MIKKSGIFPTFLLGLLMGILLQKFHIPGIIRWKVILTFTRDQDYMSRKTNIISLKVRDFYQSVDDKGFDTEEDGKYVEYEISVPISQIALILIDVWADHPNDGWRERERKNIQERLLPLVEAARKSGMLIVHSPHGRPIHPSVKPLPQEVVVDGENEQSELLALLRKRQIKYLLYAGYATNMCVLTRPTGIIEMARAGYAGRIILVRDATIAVEPPEFLKSELAHKAAVHMVENLWGMSTTVDDVIQALKEVKGNKNIE
jgi:nicotinamidase-related amidase